MDLKFLKFFAEPRAMAISDQLKLAITRSGLTHYRIGKDAGVSPISIDRFVSGERPNLRIDTVDRLCDALGLELREKKRRTAPKQTSNRSRNTPSSSRRAGG
jgi:hypothetical protein